MYIFIIYVHLNNILYQLSTNFFFVLQGARKSEEENLLAENDRMLDNLAGKVSRLKAVCTLKCL